MRLLIVVLALALTGCATTGPTVVLPAVDTMRTPPQEAQAPCPNLPGLKERSMGALMEWAGEVIGLYKDCQRKQKEQAEWIDRTFEK